MNGIPPQGIETITEEIIVGDVPGSVTGLGFVEGDKSVQLNWTAPAITYTYPITGYVIESKVGTWSAIVNTSLTTSYTVITHGGSSLINGNEYSFRVSAMTSVGTGSSTEIADGPAIPHTAPSAPVFQSLTSGDRSITATWTALSIPENGGRPIADYEVQYKYGIQDHMD